MFKSTKKQEPPRKLGRLLYFDFRTTFTYNLMYKNQKSGECYDGKSKEINGARGA